MPDAQTAGVEVWGKAVALGLGVAAALRYIVQLGRLIERIETLTVEVERLRAELADARVEIAKLRGELDGAN